jgi:hypothetical protein
MIAAALPPSSAILEYTSESLSVAQVRVLLRAIVNLTHIRAGN